MSRHPPRPIACGRTDRAGALVEADEALAALHRACGGRPGGVLAVPELRALCEQASRLGLRIARSFAAVGQGRRVTGWVDIAPHREEGCELVFASWQSEAVSQDVETRQGEHIRRELNRVLPEFTACLDAEQRVMTVDAAAADLAELAARMTAEPGRAWTEFVTPLGGLTDHPLHWRLLDGATCLVPGSPRRWTAWLEPLGVSEPGSAGFVLTLVSDTAAALAEPVAEQPPAVATLGSELTPRLRQPIDRVLAQAETIRSKLAGPLPDIYAGYAGDIIDAGEHLGALIDDIADLEGVEGAQFVVTPERIDLGEAARQACAILGGKAQEARIALVPPPPGEVQMAMGEFRRVLQVLINLISNAVAYSPADSQVWIRLDRSGRMSCVTVADQGRGLTGGEQARVFDKFERLGRSDAAGSGLGLYISKQLARAMEGELSVESAPGQGARFTLCLPATGES